jgi:hypothetical protein
LRPVERNHLPSSLVQIISQFSLQDKNGYLQGMETDNAIETGQELERLRLIAGADDFAGLQSDSRWKATLRKYLAAWGYI